MTSFLGSWSIVDTQLWGADDLDLLGPPEIVFESDGLGSLRLGALEAGIDYRVTSDSRGPMAEFSWSGYDDGDLASGRGWARIESGRLRGRLFIYLGDDSEFMAVRTESEER